MPPAYELVDEATTDTKVKAAKHHKRVNKSSVQDLYKLIDFGANQVCEMVSLTPSEDPELQPLRLDFMALENALTKPLKERSKVDWGTI